MKEQKTASRATLAEEWRRRQQKMDWMTAPGMASYVNSLVSGKPLHEGGHWALYAAEQHVIPLAKTRDSQRLSMLSLGCGSAHIERSLIEEFRWPVDRLHGLEFDAEMRRVASESFASLDCNAQFSFFDFNDDSQPQVTECHDLVFCCHAIHHADNLEALIPFVQRVLKPDGLFIGIDYFGPTRFQIEYEVMPIIEELFSLLPEELKYDLRENQPVVNPVRRATIAEVRDADVSESVRSSDLRTLLFSNFQVAEVKPMGGTLLRWLLQYRAGNFDPANATHTSISRLLQFIERELIASRRIRSDDLFFVLTH